MRLTHDADGWYVAQGEPAGLQLLDHGLHAAPVPERILRRPTANG